MVYSSDRDGAGATDIWVQAIGAPANPVRLTNNPASDSTPDFSPDGRTVVFRSSREGGGLYTVPARGGEERKLTDGGFSPRYSPDGAWVAYSKIEESGSAGIFVLPSQGGDPLRLASRVSNATCPVWADGRHIAFVAARPGSEDYDIWVARFDPSQGMMGKTSTRTRLTDLLQKRGIEPINASACDYAWIGQNILLGKPDKDYSAVWQIRISPNDWTAFDTGLQKLPLLTSPKYARAIRAIRIGDARVFLFFQVEQYISHIWSLQADSNRGIATGSLERLTYDSSLRTGLRGTSARLSRDGGTLVWASRHSGNADIRVKDLIHGREDTVTSAAITEDRPVINSNGSKVAYMTVEGNRTSVVLLDLNTKFKRTLCDNCGEPKDWSPDNTKILSVDRGSVSWIDTRDGTRTELLKSGKYQAEEVTFSPDGQWIALVAGMSGSDRLQGLILPVTSGFGPEAEWVQVGTEAYEYSLHWSPDGTMLYFFSMRDGFRCLYAQRYHGPTRRLGTANPVMHFHQHQRYPVNGSWISVSKDRIVVTLGERLSNIWMTERTRL